MTPNNPNNPGNIPITKTETDGNETKTETTKAGSNTNGNGQTKNLGSLKQLFEEEIKEIYNAEKQLLQALPLMAEACYDEELQDVFNEHLSQTKRQIERLEKVFLRLRINREDKRCVAMEGLIEECKQIIKDYDQSPVRDTALIIGAQKVEHYEIACYGSLCELADVLGLYKIADTLDRSLAEEENTDMHLTEIARGVNDEALEMSRRSRRDIK